MYKTQTTFLNDSSGTVSISHELNNKKADSILQRWEVELLSVSNIRRQVVSILIAVRCLQSIKIDSSVKWLQVLFVVSLCIELKHLDMQDLNVLNNHLETDILFDSKYLLVLLAELKLHYIAHLLVEVKRDQVLVQ